MNWHTVYDISTADAGEYFGFVLFGAGMLVLAGGFLWRARRRGERSPTAKVVAGFGVLVAVLGYGVNTWDQNRLAAHLAAGEVQTVDGAVFAHARWREDITDSRRDSTRRYRHWERVVVGGVTFIWPPGAQQPGFTNAQTPPLDLHDGQWLRITWVEDVADEASQRRIVKLESGDPPPGYAGPAAGSFGVPTSVLPGAPYPSVLK